MREEERWLAQTLQDAAAREGNLDSTNVTVQVRAVLSSLLALLSLAPSPPQLLSPSSPAPPTLGLPNP